MSGAEFIVSFDGPGIVDGRMDVRDLAPALLSLGRPRPRSFCRSTTNPPAEPTRLEPFPSEQVGNFFPARHIDRSRLL